MTKYALLSVGLLLALAATPAFAAGNGAAGTAAGMGGGASTGAGVNTGVNTGTGLNTNNTSTTSDSINPNSAAPTNTGLNTTHYSDRDSADHNDSTDMRYAGRRNRCANGTTGAGCLGGGANGSTSTNTNLDATTSGQAH